MTMDENPYQSPKTTAPAECQPKLTTWHPLTWAVVGFGVGTLLAAPFVMSSDLRGQIEGGMIFGGLFGAIYGLGHGLQRRRKERAAMLRRDDWDTPITVRRTPPARPRR